MQIIFLGDSLHEMSNPSGKNQQKFVNLSFAEFGQCAPAVNFNSLSSAVGSIQR